MENLIVNPNYEDKLMSEKPCHFLNSEKCDIYKFRPLSCKLFPFILNDPECPQYPHISDLVNVETCPVGRDLLIDYTNWTILKGQQNNWDQSIVLELVNKMFTTLKPFYSEEVPEKFQIIGFRDHRIGEFLLFLETFHPGPRLESRKNIEKLLLSA